MGHGENVTFDYYYGLEAEQYSFYRVPRLLIKDKRFKGLSSDAKLLYGLMLDRMALSMKNGWFDKYNRAYIYYTVENIMEDLGCSRGTCIKILAELDSKKGIGLIEKKRQGLGRPDIIYVKNFVTVASPQEPIKEEKEEEPSEKPDKSTEVQILDFQKSSGAEASTSRSSNFELQENTIIDVQKYKKETPRSTKNELQEVQELDGNYIDINDTENSYTDSNLIYPSTSRTGEKKEDVIEEKMEEIDGTKYVSDYINLIKQNIDYEYLVEQGIWKDKELYAELFDIICEVVCVKRKTVRIGRQDYPYELVKSKFLKLNSNHLQYVVTCMQNTITKIGNIKSYMITALYNASSTMQHYYQQAVQYDMYGKNGENRVLCSTM